MLNWNAFTAKLRPLPALLHADMKQWCRGRVWWYRLPLLLFMIWITVQYTADRDYLSIFGAINLGIHEMGHLVFAFLGQVMTALGGSLLQCLAPLIGMIVLLRVHDWFGVPFCGVWLGTNLCYVATYMADARAMALPLVSLGGGEVYHDWEFLFATFGLLEADTFIAGVVYALAILVLWASVAFGAWIIWMLYAQTD